MSSLEWGETKWEVDKVADSLNTDLFGVMKTKRKRLVPDISVDQNNVRTIPDSDDEHLTKKDRKKMKEKMRKKKKKSTDNNPNDEISNTNIVKTDGQMKAKLDEDIIKGDKRKKRRKKKKQKKNEAPPSEERDEEKMSDLPIQAKKQNKRKRSDSDAVNVDNGLPAKKAKATEGGDTGDNVEEPQVKKKRRNRKKKNNSKKNLPLNSKGESDENTEKTESEQNSIKEKKNVAEKMKDTLQTQNSLQLSNLTQEIDSVKNNGRDCQAKKKKSKKRKADTMNKEISSVKENLGNVVVSYELPVKSSNDKIGKKIDEKANDTSITGLSPQINGKSKTILNKQVLKNMLCLSSSGKKKADDQTERSDLNISDSNKSKKNKKKRKQTSSMSDKNASGMHLNQTSDSDKHEHSAMSLDLKSPAEELKDKAREKLNAARFRFINQQLYTCKGHEALQLFRQDHDAFEVYHQGFQSQTTKWPVNPLDAIIKHINNRPKDLIVADFGCGDARLGRSVPQKVHSFDLVALNDQVTACDMSKTPLPDDSIDIAVFCLSLMGTNLNDYVLEANRVLKSGGLLKIAEVSSRFHSPQSFIKQISNLGFQLLNQRKLSEMFYMMDFKKSKRIKKSPFNTDIKLKPCLYKKR